MNSAEKEAVLHCLKSMIDEALCEECPLYGTTGTDHCEADCVRLAINALEQEPCVDAISRQAVEDAIEKAQYSRDFCKEHHIDYSISMEMVRIVLHDLPPVKPAEKVGQWIVKGESWYCSRCKEPICEIYDGKPYEKYCPNCGSYNGGGDNGNE